MRINAQLHRVIGIFNRILPFGLCAAVSNVCYIKKRPIIGDLFPAIQTLCNLIRSGSRRCFYLIDSRFTGGYIVNYLLHLLIVSYSTNLRCEEGMLQSTLKLCRLRPGRWMDINEWSMDCLFRLRLRICLSNIIQTWANVRFHFRLYFHFLRLYVFLRYFIQRRTNHSRSFCYRLWHRNSRRNRWKRILFLLSCLISGMNPLTAADQRSGNKGR